jgi:hypothetical protein
MSNRKHIYFITISDVQRVAKESIGRILNPSELEGVTEKLLDNIQWFDVLEEAIASVTEDTNA